ncbi:MAG: class I adenylate cyclase [Pseudomonadota bacterium]
MLQKTFIHNKKIYLTYNHFRKNIFLKLAPKDAESILHLLPWMLSVNDPAVPSYVPNLKRAIAVFGASTDQALIKREPSFKALFNIRKSGSLLKPSTQVSLIQGLYTIGSVGTISQTAHSDCDIWVCINHADFDESARAHLLQKINLIKDWMDTNLKIPVYFFICDLEDIQNSNFGVTNEESSGSAQRNVLKEEFYRTSILISGKIPLWWVCFDPDESVDYHAFSAQYANDVFADYDCIDMGAPATINHDEYFGASLWQFNKALTHPLKSVMKMLLLDMLLVSPEEDLLCNRFRNSILDQTQNLVFHDPSVFTLNAILQYSRRVHPEKFEFIMQCSYLRYDLHFHAKKLTLKETLAKEIFQTYPLNREQIYRLNDFAGWPLLEQLEFGEKIFSLLLNIYKGIMAHKQDVISGITRQDMTIIGRKLAVCLERKRGKINIIHKPLFNPNLPTLLFVNDKKLWHVSAVGEPSKPVVASADIVYCIAYLAWNDLYNSSNVRMTPNPTPITLQEINNLAKRIREIFSVFDITGADFDHFLETEKVTTMLIVVNFEKPGHVMDIDDFCVIYSNHWGELFFQRFGSPDQFQAFIDHGGVIFERTQMHVYVQRNSLYYEKIIERVKNLVSQAFSDRTAFR